MGEKEGIVKVGVGAFFVIVYNSGDLYNSQT